jgi:hypothetical protein
MLAAIAPDYCAGVRPFVRVDLAGQIKAAIAAPVPVYFADLHHFALLLDPDTITLVTGDHQNHDDPNATDDH